MTTTDDTRQRTIPDILGWERAPDEWGYTGPMWQHPDGGRCVDDRGGWTADDLLGWLRGQLRDPEWNTEAGVNIYVSDEGVSLDWYDQGGGDGLRYPEPTLLAALEAACRAVAEVES